MMKHRKLNFVLASAPHIWFKCHHRFRCLTTIKWWTVFLLQLVQSLHVLSHHVLFYNLSSPEQILEVFPESFHSSLKNLITKILLENRSASQNSDWYRPVHFTGCQSLQTTSQHRQSSVSHRMTLNCHMINDLIIIYWSDYSSTFYFTGSEFLRT